MAEKVDLFVCRATYSCKKEKGIGIGSKIYAFNTTGFGTAESLAYNAVKKESDYAAAAKVTSIKRKNRSALDNTTVGSGEYLYRCTARNLLHISSSRIVSVSFVFPSSVSPKNGLDIQALTAEVKSYIKDKGYSWQDSGKELTTVIFSLELYKKSVQKAKS